MDYTKQLALKLELKQAILEVNLKLKISNLII